METIWAEIPEDLKRALEAEEINVSEALEAEGSRRRRERLVREAETLAAETGDAVDVDEVVDRVVADVRESRGAVTHLLDASRLVDASLSGRVEAAFDRPVPDLSPDEVGNTLWKNHHLRGEIGDGPFQRLLALLVELLDDIEVEPVDGLGLGRTMTLVIDESITYYTTAHVACATRADQTLVPEDRELGAIACPDVETARLDEM